MISPLPISVIIVARNEAGNLPRCLASVTGWTTESVVALNGCTDQSSAVAEAAGARTHDVVWQGFRDTKNAALELARQPWALCLDADEEVSPALRADIEHFFVRGDDRRYTGARFPRKVWFIDRWITHGDWYPDHNLRLIRLGRARWGGDAFLHEKLECDGPVMTLVGDLHHYSFPTLSDHVGKINAYADLFVRARRGSGQRFSVTATLFRPVWRFIRAYFLRLGFFDGFPGLYIAVATAFGTFVRYSRLYEEEHRRDPLRRAASGGATGEAGPPLRSD